MVQKGEGDRGQRESVIERRREGVRDTEIEREEEN